MIVQNVKSDIDIGSPGPEEETVEGKVEKRKGKKSKWEKQRNEERGL